MMTESWFVGRLRSAMSTWRRTASRVNLQKIPLFPSQKSTEMKKKLRHDTSSIPNFIQIPSETSKTPRLGGASRGGGGGTQRLSRKSREKSLRPGAPSCGGSKCPDSNGSAMLEYQGRGTICKGWTLLAILGICNCVSRELLGISYKTPPGPNTWKSQLRPFKSWRDGSGAGIRWI